MTSPLAARAWILEARALAAQPAEAVRLLREHYGELPQPEGDLALADSYQAANDLAREEFYRRVYYQYVSGAAAARAAAALTTLKDTMGVAYPPPLPAQMLNRADRLMDARDYDRAFAEYQPLPGQLARVRTGEAELLRGNLSAATMYLRSLEVTEPEADAERLYYLEDCARRAGNDAGIQSAVEQLGQRYPKSSWRLRALASAASRFLLVNQPDAYLPLYRAAYEDFPDAPAAGLYHWKVTFHAYIMATATRRTCSASTWPDTPGTPPRLRRSIF